ncbi:helix-turn-helix domain-containing protein [Flavobacterium sp. GCM10023249]|uniref:helix-turn-helix domain-containing protein n=1 Tax=unclassified Flavobacterium TaxID=196869 RepID=UPI00361973DD
MRSIIQQLREERNLTQTELAEKSGLSLRTIQRIEAGTTPKGFTLKALAQVFETEPEKLIPTNETLKVDRAKWINFSTLAGLIIPFGSILFPLVLTYKTKDPKNKELGKCIVSFQILLTVVISLVLIAIPFVQKGLSLQFPLFLIPVLLLTTLNLVAFIVNGISLNQQNDLHKAFKINYL